MLVFGRLVISIIINSVNVALHGYYMNIIFKKLVHILALLMIDKKRSAIIENQIIPLSFIQLCQYSLIKKVDIIE